MATAGAVVVAGCGGNSDSEGANGGNGGDDGRNVEESGTVENEEYSKEIEVQEGGTIRVEVTKEAGEDTLVTMENPGGSQVINGFVTDEETFTHTAEQGGVFTVTVAPIGGTASYQIYTE